VIKEAGRRYTEDNFIQIIEIRERQAYLVQLIMDQFDQRLRFTVIAGDWHSD